MKQKGTLVIRFCCSENTTTYLLEKKNTDFVIKMIVCYCRLFFIIIITLVLSFLGDHIQEGIVVGN